VPPLEERKEDIPLLVQHFLKISNGSNQRNVQITRDALELLTRMRWPGNVRELENLIERLAIFCASGEIGVVDVERERNTQVRSGLETPTTAATPSTLEEMERQHILRVLEEARGNKSQAARALGIERKTLYDKARRMGISLRSGKP
jgi:DNA-binding NtrC family response regulator